jgi:hypothetical protein
MCVEPNVDAHRKITLPWNSSCSFVSASSTRTPLALSLLPSKMSSWTIELGRSVMFPVFSAAGSVLELLLK